MTYFILEGYRRPSPWYGVRDAEKQPQWEFCRMLLMQGCPVYATMAALHEDGCQYVYCYDEDYKLVEMIGAPDGPPIEVPHFEWPTRGAKPTGRRRISRRKELRVGA